MDHGRRVLRRRRTSRSSCSPKRGGRGRRPANGGRQRESQRDLDERAVLWKHPHPPDTKPSVSLVARQETKEMQPAHTCELGTSCKRWPSS